jgi:hypothetical protein
MTVRRVENANVIFRQVSEMEGVGNVVFSAISRNNRLEFVVGMA